MSDANEFLMNEGGGPKGASFPTIGTTVTGVISGEPRLGVVTDPNTGVVKTFPDGSPIKQITVTILTSFRDPEIDGDTGERTLYIKNRMIRAIQEAVRRSGRKGLEIGGQISVTFTGEEGRTKLYSASYTPPPSAGNDALMNEPAPGTATTLPAGYGAPGGSGAAVPATPYAASIGVSNSAGNGGSAPPPPGVDPAMWERMAPEQRQMILAAMAAPSASAPPF